MWPVGAGRRRARGLPEALAHGNAIRPEPEARHADREAAAIVTAPLGEQLRRIARMRLHRTGHDAAFRQTVGGACHKTYPVAAAGIWPIAYGVPQPSCAKLRRRRPTPHRPVGRVARRHRLLARRAGPIRALGRMYKEFPRLGRSRPVSFCAPPPAAPRPSTAAPTGTARRPSRRRRQDIRPPACAARRARRCSRLPQER